MTDKPEIVLTIGHDVRAIFVGTTPTPAITFVDGASQSNGLTIQFRVRSPRTREYVKTMVDLLNDLLSDTNATTHQPRTDDGLAPERPEGNSGG